jgi:UPF0716 protein FxsA
MKYFIFIFIFLPIIEIYFFVKIGTEIGAITTIMFTFFTAFLGLATIRYQGVSSFVQARQSILSPLEPGVEILSNFALLICGILLLVPGFFTDFLGIILLFPISRRILIKFFIKKANYNYRTPSQNKSKDNDYIDVDPDN